MHRRQFLATASLAAAWPSLRLRAEAQQAADTRLDEIAALIAAKMTEYHVPGVALGVFAGGQTAIRVFGVTNVDDPQPVTADTICTVASISKTVTTTAVMKLVEDGRVDLDAPSATLHPRLPRAGRHRVARGHAAAPPHAHSGLGGPALDRGQGRRRARRFRDAHHARLATARRRPARCGATTTRASRWRAG